MAKQYLTSERVSVALNGFVQYNKIYRDGYTAYTYRQAQVAAVDRRQASLTVFRYNGLPHLVAVTLQEDGTLAVGCNCTRANDPCAHKVAALLALNFYLQQHPPFAWKQALAPVVKPERATRKAGGGGNTIIVFSLSAAANQSAHIGLYSLSRKHLPGEVPDDGPALAQAIHAARVDARLARPIYTRSDFSTVLNQSTELIAAAGLLIASPSYYGQDSLHDTVIPLLAHCPVFLNKGGNPLAQPVTISPDEASPELVSEQGEDGLRLTLWLTLGEQRFQVKPGTVHILGRKAGWQLYGDTIFRAPGVQPLLNSFLQYPDVEVPPDDIDEFIAEFLLPLAERVPFSGEFSVADELSADPVKRVYLSEENGIFRAELRFGYAEHEFPYVAHQPGSSLVRRVEDGALLRLQRQPEEEEEAWKALSGFGLKRGEDAASYVLRKSVGVVDFLLHQVPKLAQAGFEVYGEEALTSARVNRNKPTINFTVSSGIDWFDVQAVVNFGELEVGLKELRRAVHRRERFIKLADGTIGAIPAEWLERYRRLLDLDESSGEKLRLSAAQVTLLDALLDDADGLKADEQFEERRRRLRDFSSIEHRDPPRGFTGELRHYQQAGYEWLHFLHEYGFGGCLADDMGTGKTVQALALLLSLRESGHASAASLIVAPRSLIFNWQRETERFAPGLRVLVHADGDRDQSLETIGQYDIVLTTYGVLLRDIEQLRQYTFHYVILDESQTIKNPASQTAKAARLLCADHRLVLTGTPVENNTTELWSQFAFLNPGLLGSQEFFRREFALPIEKNGSVEAVRTLRRLIFPFILRRTKDQVATELPPRTERIVYCEMEPAQQSLYVKTRDRYRAMLLGIIEEQGMDNARMKVLEGLLRLRQLSNHPRLVEASFTGTSAKFDELLELLETLRAEGHKALVFSQFTSMLAIVREALDTRGVPYEYLDGRTKDRQARVDAFQQKTETPFFLISLKAGGVGLNLTAADYVIHIDPWWNPAVEMQASDRAHRIGQERPVFIYKLIMKDSVEEKVLLLQERKRDLVNNLIHTESGLFKSLTRDDVADLFS